MRTVSRAARIVTMDESRRVIEDGGILVEDGRILAVAPWREVALAGEPHDLGPVTLVPGLVNAHTHLELSHLRNAVPAGLGFPAWADGLFGRMRELFAEEEAIADAVGLARAAGTCAVGDVCGRQGDVVHRELQHHGVGGHLFREFAGAAGKREFHPGTLPAPWSPGVHSLYSTSPQLARAVKAWCAARDLPFSLHLAEVPGENELFSSGEGSFADFVRARRILPKGFAPPGMSAVAFARHLGLLDARTLAVHCVQVDAADVEILRASGATVCLCMRSNAWIGVGEAPAASLLAANVPLCLGTDSLASNADLDLWNELRAVRAMLPGTPLMDLLAMVTAIPARALGLDSEYGSLQPGRRACWSELPADLCREPSI